MRTDATTRELELVPRTKGCVRPPEGGPAWRAAQAAGMDLSLIELSLSKSPWERWEEHDNALSFALAARAGVQRYYGEA